MVFLDAGPKKYLSLKEAADLLSVSEEVVRLKVRQGLLKPLNYEKHYGERLFFKAEDILGIWESFLINDQNIRDAIRYLVCTQKEILGLLGNLSCYLSKPRYVTLREAAKYLGVHPVTLRKKIRRKGASQGIIELGGLKKSLRLIMLENSWRIRREDLNF